VLLVKNETRSFYETAVQRAVEHIASGLDGAIDLAALARIVAVSPFHFHRIFRGMVGETPLELHRRLRMERAAHALAHGDAPVTRIAFDAGYETHESFTRAFGDRYGTSPSAFRESASHARDACARPPQIELAARSGLHFTPAGSIAVLSFQKGESKMNVTLKDMKARRVITVHHTGPYNRISEAFERLGHLAGASGLLGREGTEMLALYYDDPEAVPADKLRSDAALTIPETAPLPNGASEARIPAGRYACAVHQGPYTGLGDAWAELLGTWVPQSGHRVADGPSFEIYRNNPTNTSPDKLLTEICVPLA
jgi:AraC family transcriptional regulator